MDDGFVQRYHQGAAGITEDLLTDARDAQGRNPYQWLAEPLPATGPVLDLASGTAPMADIVGVARYLGMDRSAEELALARLRRPTVRLVRGDVGTAGLGGQFVAVTASMALMLLDLERLLATVTRLLAPGGVLAATVPTRDDDPGEAEAARRLLDGLRTRGSPLPYPVRRIVAVSSPVPD